MTPEQAKTVEKFREILLLSVDMIDNDSRNFYNLVSMIPDPKLCDLMGLNEEGRLTGHFSERILTYLKSDEFARVYLSEIGVL